MLQSQSVSQDSSESAKTDPPTSLASVSHTQTNPLPASSMTQTKRTYCQSSQLQPYMLVPPFKPNCLATHKHPFHSPTMSLLTKHSSLPSPEYETMSTTAVRTSSRLKRSSELAELSNTAELPATTKKPHCSLPNSTPYAPWDWSLIPLHHHHPLTSPFRHLLYCATRKSRPVPWPPMPESIQWPADRLRPSRLIPVDHGVWGLKLVTWELKYRLFQKAFESELSCCLLARQEELRRHLP